MKASFILSLALAAFATASPIADAQPEAEASLAQSLAAALPHPIEGSDKRDLSALLDGVDTKIVSAVKPVDLVTRQAKGKRGKGKGKRANAAKRVRKGKGKAANVVVREASPEPQRGKGKGGRARGKGKGKGRNRAE